MILELAMGDDFDIEREVTSLPEEQTLETAWFAVKLNEADDDEDALIFKEITSELVEDAGQIGQNSAGNPTVLFKLLAAETATLEKDIYYFYGIKVQTNAGVHKQIETGRIIASAALVKNDEHS